MLTNIPADFLEKLKARIPVRRLANPEEIARLARFLIMEGDYITGQAIGINGGFYC
jgi:NAD(P)-dependent dehydrogenase (short-subunit alcohol dehydrogenase family)